MLPGVTFFHYFSLCFDSIHDTSTKRHDTTVLHAVLTKSMAAVIYRYICVSSSLLGASMFDPVIATSLWTFKIWEVIHGSYNIV